jgi:hypothetical protein
MVAGESFEVGCMGASEITILLERRTEPSHLRFGYICRRSSEPLACLPVIQPTTYSDPALLHQIKPSKTFIKMSKFQFVHALVVLKDLAC